MVVAGVAYRPGEAFEADARDRRVARWVRAGMVVLVDEPAEPLPLITQPQHARLPTPRG